MAFEKLRALRCFPEVDKKIRAGIPCENIAEWIQEDQGEYTDVKRESLVRQLYRYKESIPGDELETPDGLYVRKKIENLKRGVNEAAELEKLYLLQLSRISMMVQTEDKIKFIQKGTRGEIEAARQILLDLAKLKIELGVYSRQPFTIQGQVDHTISRKIEELPPERRREMGRVAQELLSGLKGLLESGEDTQTLPSGEEVQEAEYELIEN